MLLLQGTERADNATSVQDTITGPTRADVMPAPELDSQAKIEHQQCSARPPPPVKAVDSSGSVLVLAFDLAIGYAAVTSCGRLHGQFKKQLLYPGGARGVGESNAANPSLTFLVEIKSLAAAACLCSGCGALSVV
jgi:hypothetical protein